MLPMADSGCQASFVPCVSVWGVIPSVFSFPQEWEWVWYDAAPARFEQMTYTVMSSTRDPTDLNRNKLSNNSYLLRNFSTAEFWRQEERLQAKVCQESVTTISSSLLHLYTACFCPSLHASLHRDKHEVCRMASWDLCAAVNSWQLCVCAFACLCVKCHVILQNCW